jgi:hypothetical protein
MSLRSARAQGLLSQVSDPGKLRTSSGEFAPLLHEAINELFDNTFATQAFQAALVCGFFEIIESAESKAHAEQKELDRNALFEEYIECLNKFYAPKSASSMKDLVRAFFYDLPDGHADQWKPVLSEHTFRGVVAPHEMKPDEWPKYRYLNLELWQSTEPVVESTRTEVLELCRKQAFQNLFSRQVKRFCQTEQRHQDDLSSEDRKKLLGRTMGIYDSFLKSLGLKTKNQRISEVQANQWATLGNVDEDSDS